MSSVQPWDWEELSRHCLREARRVTRTASDAEDVAQEALLRAWRYRDRCRDPGSRKAWVARICGNEMLPSPPIVTGTVPPATMRVIAASMRSKASRIRAIGSQMSS